MKEILETTRLEFDKSIFLIDMVKHDKGGIYIEIVQIIHNDETNIHRIKINPTVLTDLLAVLRRYQVKIPLRKAGEPKILTDSDQQKIQDRYFKGVHIKDLAVQFDQNPHIIEMVLRNKGIPIVSNEMP